MDESRLPFGITSAKPSTMQTLADSKVPGFVMGAQKRSNPFQRHKEEAELKRKREAEEAAKALEDFEASFQVDESTTNNKKQKTFVKGKSSFVPSVFGEDNEYEEPTPPPRIGAAFKGAPPIGSSTLPASSTSSAQPSTSKNAFSNSNNNNFAPSSLESKPKSEGAGNGGGDQSATNHIRDAKAKKKRDMDEFLEEIKRGQEERDSREQSRQQQGHTRGNAQDEYRHHTGSRDTGDPLTTNIYVGNIHPAVTEEMLCHEFAPFGPIASIKIMWPRTTEEIERNRNCGFVSFMERHHAAMAIKEKNGYTLQGHVMQLGWGKAVALPAVPFYTSPDYIASTKSNSSNNKRPTILRPSISRSHSDIVVTKPTDPNMLRTIHGVVERVLVLGTDFETVLMSREESNPMFRFLWDFKSSDHIYYRWKLFSLSQGDTVSRWRVQPFRMVERGPFWIPPLPRPFTDEVISEDEMLMDCSDDEFEKSPAKGQLSRGAREYYEAQLRGLTMQRRKIGKAMVFAIQNADAADEIVELIIDSLVLPETPFATRLARLYLISDILHNSSLPTPNVWKFRSLFETKLPAVFEVLNTLYRAIDGRLKAEQFRRQIANILTVWENWIVFPQTYLDQLLAILVQKSQVADVAASPSTTVMAGLKDGGPQHLAGTTEGSKQTFVPAVSSSTMASNLAENTDAVYDDVDGEPMEDEDLDGMPMDDSGNGNGEDDDIDGMPM